MENTLNAQQLLEAREWLKELTFADYESPEEVSDMIDGLTDAQVEKAVDRHCEGGIYEFIECCTSI